MMNVILSFHSLRKIITWYAFFILNAVLLNVFLTSIVLLDGILLIVIFAECRSTSSHFAECFTAASYSLPNDFMLMVILLYVILLNAVLL
jgi:hypothetical protein